MSRTMNGWVKLHRSIYDNPIVTKSADHLAIWIYLLTHATPLPYNSFFGGKPIELKPGQLLTSRKSIANSLNSRIDESKVERVLKAFKNAQLIEQQTCNKNRLITLINWDKYQKGEQQIAQQLNNNCTTTEQQPNTYREDREDNNLLSTDIDEREDFSSIKDSFNRICTSFKPIRVITDKRKAAIRKAKDLMREMTFDELFEKIEHSDYLTKRDGLLTVPIGFDWILKSGNLIKIIEGNYDNDEEYDYYEAYEEDIYNDQ